MKLLLLGGSYFLGKQFVLLTKESHELTVFNRGTRPFCDDKVKQITGDRHNKEDLNKLKNEQYDAVIDFCAYEKGDIADIFEVLGGNVRQYVFVSTVDVYERGLERMLDESGPFEERYFGPGVGDYISGKVALEQEIVQCAKQYDAAYTVVRPAFIYGPGNYADREAMYFQWIFRAAQILHPTDATGEFQMVYVKDVACFLEKVLLNVKAYNQAYNLAPEPMVTYESFADALKNSIAKPFERVKVTVQMVNEKGLPLPFPLLKEESNWYNGRKALELLGGYTDLEKGLTDTYNHWMASHTNDN